MPSECRDSASRSDTSRHDSCRDTAYFYRVFRDLPAKVASRLVFVKERKSISNPAEIPNYELFVELPDGGAVRLLDQAPSMNTDAEVSDEIVVIGSDRGATPGALAFLAGHQSSRITARTTRRVRHSL